MEVKRNDNNEENKLKEQNDKKEDNPNTNTTTTDNMEVVNMEEDNAENEEKIVPESPVSHRTRSRSRSPINSNQDYKQFMVIENLPSAYNFFLVKKMIVEALTPEMDIKLQDIFVISPEPTVQILRFFTIKHCEKAIACMDGKEIKGCIVRASFDTEGRYKSYKWRNFGEKPYKDTATGQTIPSIMKTSKAPYYVKPKLNSLPERYTRENNPYGLSVSFLKALEINYLKKKVFVKNLNIDVNTETLRNIFSKAGDILSITITKQVESAFAKVEFDHPVEAVQAISMFHNKDFNGKKLCVRMDWNKIEPEMISEIGPGVGTGGVPIRYYRIFNNVKLMKEHYNKEIDTLKKMVNDLKSQLEQQCRDYTKLQNTVAMMNSNSVQNGAFNIGNPATPQNMMQNLAMLQNQFAQMYSQMGQMTQMNQLSGMMGSTTDQTSRAGQVASQPGWGQVSQIANQIDYSTAQNSQTTGQLGFMGGQMGLNMGQMGHTGDQPAGQMNQAAGQFNQITGQINPATGNMNQVAGQIKTAIGSMSQITGQMNQATGQMTPATGNMNQVAGQMNPATGNMNQMTGQMIQMPGQMNQMPGQMNQMPGQMNQIPDQMNQMPGQMNQMTGQMNQMTDQRNQMSGQINLGTGQMNQMSGQINQVTGQFNQVPDQFNQVPGQMNLSPGNMNQGTSQMNPPTGQYNQAIGKINEITGHMDRSVNQIKQSTQNTSTSRWSNKPDKSRSNDNRQTSKKPHDDRYSVKSVSFNKDGDRGRESDMLVFNNLPPSVTVSVLLSKMREIGDLKFAEIVGNGKAIVRFHSQRVASRCLDLFHRSKVDGQVVDVKYL